jgi:putative transposase
MKFRFISAHRETFKVGRMCSLLNVSRSGYYMWLGRPESRRSRENRALENKIRLLHAASHGIYGAPKIHQDLVDDGVRCGKTALPESCAKPASDLEPRKSSKQPPTPITSCR